MFFDETYDVKWIVRNCNVSISRYCCDGFVVDGLLMDCWDWEISFRPDLYSHMYIYMCVHVCGVVIDNVHVCICIYIYQKKITGALRKI